MSPNCAVRVMNELRCHAKTNQSSRNSPSKKDLIRWDIASELVSRERSIARSFDSAIPIAVSVCTCALTETYRRFQSFDLAAHDVKRHPVARRNNLLRGQRECCNKLVFGRDLCQLISLLERVVRVLLKYYQQLFNTDV